MIISSGTVDFWLYASGTKNQRLYYDYQHHHWDIKASGPINNMIANRPVYAWSVDAFGQDIFGSWNVNPNWPLFKLNGSSVLHFILPTLSNAQVWIPPPQNNTLVKLIQTVSSNSILSKGSNPAITDHQVSEPQWPSLTWLTTSPSPVTSPANQGQPPVFRNGSLVFPGTGGIPYAGKIQLFQNPDCPIVTGWWSWTINLA